MHKYMLLYVCAVCVLCMCSADIAVSHLASNRNNNTFLLANGKLCEMVVVVEKITNTLKLSRKQYVSRFAIFSSHDFE